MRYRRLAAFAVGIVMISGSAWAQTISATSRVYYSTSAWVADGWESGLTGCTTQIKWLGESNEDDFSCEHGIDYHLQPTDVTAQYVSKGCVGAGLVPSATCAYWGKWYKCTGYATVKCKAAPQATDVNPLVPGACGTGGTCSPIVLDLGKGTFAFSGLDEPVAFDLDADGQVERIGWTAFDSSTGLLVLDRDLNGRIDHGGELFGTVTDQPESDDPNGFLALAVFDAKANGGNGDGVISADDRVFNLLRVWLDVDHDGLSDFGETLRLVEAGVTWISLDFKTSSRSDRHGNLLRWRADVGFWDGRVLPRAVDVIFVRE